MKPLQKPRPNLKQTQRQLFENSTNETTGTIITYLNLAGWHVWRNNTHGVYDQQKQAYRRLSYQQKGVADIIGFHRLTGVFIAVEVKTGNDTLSADQIQFLNQVKGAKGLAFVAHTFDDFLTKYERRIQK
jgi:penicillin-binding protein-related factor A (putative recombinase)